MARQFRCAHCPATITVEHLEAGEEAECIECGEYSVVPEGDAAATPGKQAKRDVFQGRALRAFACSHCGEAITVEDAPPGQQAKCQECGKWSVVPEGAGSPATQPQPVSATPTATGILNPSVTHHHPRYLGFMRFVAWASLVVGLLGGAGVAFAALYSETPSLVSSAAASIVGGVALWGVLVALADIVEMLGDIRRSVAPPGDST